MNITPYALPGLFLIEPDVFGDSRGYFFESFREDKLNALGITSRFVQDNESKSRRGVLRGLHYQTPPFTQAKIVRVFHGAVLDVVVDIRTDSPTFGKHASIELSAENRRQLVIPRGFAHGFAVLSPEAVFVYKCDNYYSKEHDCGIAHDDPQLAIDWRIAPEDAIVSDKDSRQPLLRDATLFTTAEFKCTETARE